MGLILGKKNKVLKLNYVSGREEHSLKNSPGFICNMCIKSERHRSSDDGK